MRTLRILSMRSTVRAGVAAAAVWGAVWAAGCGRVAPLQPLRPDAFVGRRQLGGASGVQPVDQSGPVAYDAVRPDAPADAPTGQGRDISEAVQRSVRAVPEKGFQSGAEAADASGNGAAQDGAGDNGAAPPPASTPGDPAAARRPAPADPSGQYQLVGTVLAEVNGTPIFADKVLAVLEGPLAAAARQSAPPQFRAAAEQLIQQQVREFISSELEFATAQRKLEPRYEAEARARTVQWRLERITAAGGSIELAKRREEAQGYEFEERVQEEYRTFMRKLYYQKKEVPKIQVSAGDIRRYYQENLKKEFTTPARARFRVIKVDVLATGGRERALDKVRSLRARATDGKDFAQLAAANNDDPSFKNAVEWFPRGSFKIEAVEKAVWEIEPGQITDVIETDDAFYIAKLDVKEEARIVPFEEADLQVKIEDRLKTQQFGALRAQVQASLMKDAIIRQHPQMIRVSLEMAMQKYAHWNTAAVRTGKTQVP